jgi:hypothetical protein
MAERVSRSILLAVVWMLVFQPSFLSAQITPELIEAAKKECGDVLRRHHDQLVESRR